MSVCIPSYNRAQYLPAAIESVLSQEFEDFELVISDDASDDETPAVCGRYSDSRVRFVASPRRLGLAGNYNRCVELAHGDYVVLLHSDDALRPEYLKRAAAVLDAHEDVGLVHCATQHIDEAGNPLTLQRLFDTDTIDREEVTLRHLLLDGCVVSPAGVMVRREIYEAVGLFSDKIVWSEDWHMWSRIALTCPVAYISEPLSLYREHGDNSTSAVMTGGRNARQECWAVEDLFDLIRRTRPDLYHLKPAARRGVAHRTWCVAEAMCQASEMAAARVGLRSAVRIWPGMIGQPRVWGLWAATYTGYRWFASAHAWKAVIVSRVRRRPSAAD